MSLIHKNKRDEIKSIKSRINCELYQHKSFNKINCVYTVWIQIFVWQRFDMYNLSAYLTQLIPENMVLYAIFGVKSKFHNTAVVERT